MSQSNTIAVTDCWRFRLPPGWRQIKPQDEDTVVFQSSNGLERVIIRTWFAESGSISDPEGIVNSFELSMRARDALLDQPITFISERSRVEEYFVVSIAGYIAEASTGMASRHFASNNVSIRINAEQFGCPNRTAFDSWFRGIFERFKPESSA